MNDPIYNLALVLMTGDDAPEGPGWYITGGGSPNGLEGISMPPRRISIGKAEEIARAFEIAHTGNSDDGFAHPFELMKAGTESAQKAVQAKLDKAEEVASTVPSLRNSLNELTT